MDIFEQINKVNWKQYETAYGNANETILGKQKKLIMPKVADALSDLFANEKGKALEATHHLWAGLCHQHAYISSAALPSYPILKRAFQQDNDKLKLELLDIFLGFVHCSMASKPPSWQYELKQMLLKDQSFFEQYVTHKNKEIRKLAKFIMEDFELAEA